jgi:PhoH-like ATPase
MPKTYVLDTSALLDNPEIYKSFPNSTVIIPIVVINELDKKKLSPAEIGKNARVCIRTLDQLSCDGDISTGVLLDENITVKVDVSYHNSADYSGFGDPSYADTQILICAFDLLKKGEDVTLVSNDLNLRLKAKARGMNATGSEDKKTFNDLYSGEQVVVNEEAGAELQQLGFLNPDDFGLTLHSNECVLFQNEGGLDIAQGRHADGCIKLIKKIYPWNIASRNAQQSCAMDMIMDPNIDLVTLVGKAGTGKTLCILACALELVLNKRQYNKLVIYRPIQPVGNDLGYLPGSLVEKLGPWYQAILDSFEVLFATKSGDWKINLEMYQRKDKIQMEAITYIRGRSIPNAIIYVDEVQGISAQDIKTILTRAGEGTKIILSGDIDQIDNNKLNAIDNGLSYVIESFKGYDLFSHLTLTKGERSRLATLSSEIL